VTNKRQPFRINLFEQLSAFYELIWFSDFNFKSHHVAMYIFMLNQNNRCNWSLWFDFPFDLGKKGACIGSKKTYYQTIKDLQEQGLIRYEKGANEYRAPRVQLLKLQRGKNGLLPTPLVGHSDTAGDPSSGPQVNPQGGRDIDSETGDNETEDNKTDSAYPFDDWWCAYAKKVNRKKTQAKWGKLKEAEKEECMKKVKAYVQSTPEAKYRKDPLTYLNGSCWEDDIIETQEEENPWALLDSGDGLGVISMVKSRGLVQ
jgi:hypothetical protein